MKPISGKPGRYTAAELGSGHHCRKYVYLKFLNCGILQPSYVPMTDWLRHGPFATWLVNAARPRLIVELGSHFGYSYFAFCEAVRLAGLPTQCIAVDTWQGDEHTGHYGEEVYQTVLQQNEVYSSFSTLLRKTFAEALADVPDGSVDLLHVDGRHLYEDVEEDFESWIPKLTQNAIVLFHDTMVHERDFGVWKYWAELSQREETFNFTYQHGLGILFRGQDLSPEMAQFRALTRSEAGQKALNALFFAAGEGRALDNTLNRMAESIIDGKVGLETFLTKLAGAVLMPEGPLVALSPGGEAVADTLRDTLAAIHTIEAELVRHEEIVLENIRLRRELAYARSRTDRVWKDKLVYKLLTKLSISTLLPIGERARARMAKSAAKRDPKRSLRDMHALSGSLAETLALADAQAEATSSRGNVTKGKLAHDPAKADIILVTHDASWTGAPILVQNLARELSARYNVTIICMRPNVSLMPQMLEVSTGVLLLGNGNPTRQLGAFLAKSNFRFAVVNSVESRHALPALNQASVPTVALMHEFASYTLPTTAFTEVLNAADCTVFSTELTLASACETTGLSPTPFVRILPQGKCKVPATTRSAALRETERAQLKAKLRPLGSEENFLILGAGTVQMRKGVDLFIEVARKVLASPQGARARFVWIGPGFDPQSDVSYSVYLLDQLRRAGLEGRINILPSTPEIEYAYELSDAFLLSSRVDPLPNVGIDTMLLGLPVLCFDRASGIAEILREGGLAADCVADYLDPADLAQRILTLMASPEAYKRVSHRTKEIATEVFDMPRYACQIEELAQEAVVRRANRAADIEIIAKAEGFVPGNLAPSRMRVPGRTEAARAYVESFAQAVSARRPEPGFNPHAYTEHLMQATGRGPDREAYAHFLQAGRPQGPWLTPVLQTEGPAPGSARLRSALQIHAYHVGELHRILGHLAANQTRPQLFVSVTNEEDKKLAAQLLAGYAGTSKLRVVPNIGRDIGPFLTEFGRELVEGFDVVGHVHTKKSSALLIQNDVEAWKRMLFENVLGGKAGGAMADRILQAFQADPTLGLVYPSDPNYIGWTRNWQHAQGLAPRLGLTKLPQAFDFPVGTMFWIRAEALRPFVDLGLQWSDYPREPVGTDGTLLHALERLFGLVPLRHGFHSAVTRIKGITR